MNRRSLFIITAVLTVLTLVTGCSPRDNASQGTKNQKIPEITQGLNKADDLFSRRQFDEALAEYEKVLKLKPGSQRALEGSGAVLMETGKYRQAGEIFDRLIREYPENPRGMLFKASVLMQQNKPDQARELYRKAAQTHRGSLLAMLEYGRFLAYHDRSPDAVKVLSRALKQNPPPRMQANLLITRACAYGNQGNREKKQEDLVRAGKSLDEALSEEEPLRVKADMFISRAFVHKSLGNPDAAKKDLLKGIETGYRQAECYFFLTGVYIDLNDVDAAMAAMKKFDSLDPQFRQIRYRGPQVIATYHRNKGSLLASRGKLDSAIKAYEQSLEIEPENPEGLIEAANLQFLTGDVKGARAGVKLWLPLNVPRRTIGQLVNHAVAARIAGNKNKAYNFIDKAISREPDNYGLHFERAVISLLARDHKALKDDLKRFDRGATNEEKAMVRELFKKIKSGKKGFFTD